MSNLPGLEVLGFNPNSDLHRGSARIVDGGFQDQKVSDVYGVVEVHPVDAGRHYVGSRVTQRCNGSGRVDKFQDCSPVNIAHRVSVNRQHLHGKYGLGCVDGFRPFHKQTF